MNQSYQIDCFTPNSEGSQFPESTYQIDNIKDLHETISNLIDPKAGLSKIEIFIIEQEKPTKDNIVNFPIE
jgi:hypothetical protein